jgi:hypothetical protein
LEHRLELSAIGEALLKQPTAMAYLGSLRVAYLKNRLASRASSCETSVISELFEAHRRIYEGGTVLSPARQMCIWPYVRIVLSGEAVPLWLMDSRGKMLLPRPEALSGLGLSLPALLRGRVWVTDA